MIERKSVLLRLDPAVHDALARWAADELRSTNAQIEFLLRHALSDAGRMPSRVGRMPKPGRPQAAGAPSP
ncbi:MAG: type II toxin-antitoxin system antitoxin [Acidimicrobiales bacterium]